VPDEAGIELENREAAKAMASRGIVDMTKDDLPDGDRRAFVIRVRDDAGEVVLQAALSLVVEYSPNPRWKQNNAGKAIDGMAAARSLRREACAIPDFQIEISWLKPLEAG
jgi:hypothetical protein